MQTKEYHKVICWSLHEWMVILLEDKLPGICPMYHLSLDFYRAFSHKIRLTAGDQTTAVCTITPS